jgi:ApbE superfamily uncharacterized protein (UPF0280 family)
MGLKRFRLKVKETVATVIAEGEFFPIAEREVEKQREILERYISKNPDFLNSLKPIFVSDNSPEIVKRMAKASFRAGVGPMASVAGAISYFAVREMVKEGAKHVIFENGGDIAMFISEPVIIGIYSGEKVKNLGLRFKPKNSIIGVCTSSGKMGHSLSFGKADSVTVISEDPVLADAVATALCNSIDEEDPDKIERAINRFLIHGIEGVIVVIGNLVGLGGNLPEFIETPIPYELITTW